MSMNDRYSPTAAVLLAEGIDQVWMNCLGQEITHFMGDVLFQIERLSVTHVGNTNSVQCFYLGCLNWYTAAQPGNC
jgi:hypothetical protein